jgi:2-methylcitrate dehydratase PrpD
MPEVESVVEQLALVVAAHSSAAPRTTEAALLVDHLVCVSQALTSAPAATANAGSVDRAARRALLSCADDRDDVSWSQMVHSGSVVWPVVLTLARDEGSTGVEVLRAARAGHELTERSAALFGPEARARFHVTATAGTVGAAAAATVLWRHTPAQIADALGHAFSVMGGSAGCLHERSGTRQFHRAHAVRSGLAAASAAADGLHATKSDLSNSWGIVGPIDETQAKLILPSSRDALACTSVRPFPTSGWNQLVYEAASIAALQVKEPISKIVVTTDGRTIATSESHPNDADAQWVRLDWSAARAVAAVLGGDASAHVRDVHVVSREGRGATVEIVTGTGSVSAECTIPLGHPERPVPTNLLGAKWGITSDAAESLIDRVAHLLASTAPGAVDQIENAVTKSQTNQLHHEETS